MFPKSLKPIFLLAVVLATGGCATQRPASRSRLASVQSVAVTYAPSAAHSSTGSRVAGRVARHGAGFALGQLGFVGGIVGLAVDVVDISRPSREAKISGSTLRILQDAGAEPLALVARRTEQEISRRRLFTVRGANPDAVLDLELRELALKPADNRDLLCRASLAVTARLRDRAGSTLWKKEAAATSARTRLWRDCSEQPRMVRGDFDALAGVVSQKLFADFPSTPHNRR